MKKVLVLLGRIAISLIFITSAITKLFSWDATVQYMTSALTTWSSGTSMPDLVSQGFSFFCAHAVLALAIATLLEGVGGIFILLGFRVRLGATFLIIFLIPVTVIMHAFWLSSGAEKTLQLTHFMKNLSILGGLLILAAKGGEGEG